MRGVQALDLTDSTYVVTPSETVRSWDVVPYYKSMLSKSSAEYHLYNVQTADRRTVLEVMLVFDKDLSGDGFIQHTSVDTRLVFRTPAGESRLSVERTGITQTYAVEATETAAELATFRKGLRTLFRWTVYDATRTDVAVVKKPLRDRLRNAASISRHASYVVESATEGQLARFDKTRVSGGPNSWFLSEMEVDLSAGPSIPTEIPVALAATLMYAAGSTDVGGDGAE